MKVYLAGPISGLTYEEAGTWRWDTINAMAGAEFRFFNPLLPEDKNYVQESGKFGNGHDLENMTVDSFFTRDMYWVENADIILADFTVVPPTLGGGTPFELGYAMAKQKIIIVVGPKENIPMFCLKGSSIYFEILDDAIEYLKSLVPTRLYANPFANIKPNPYDVITVPLDYDIVTY